MSECLLLGLKSTVHYLSGVVRRLTSFASSSLGAWTWAIALLKEELGGNGDLVSLTHFENEQ